MLHLLHDDRGGAGAGESEFVRGACWIAPRWPASVSDRVMLLLIGALTIGLILSLLALGVFISFRIFDFPDITADGSITLGGAVAAVLIVAGVHPLLATAAAFARRRAGRARRPASCTRGSRSTACCRASW